MLWERGSPIFRELLTGVGAAMIAADIYGWLSSLANDLGSEGKSPGSIGRHVTRPPVRAFFRWRQVARLQIGI